MPQSRPYPPESMWSLPPARIRCRRFKDYTHISAALFSLGGDPFRHLPLSRIYGDMSGGEYESITHLCRSFTPGAIPTPWGWDRHPPFYHRGYMSASCPQPSQMQRKAGTLLLHILTRCDSCSDFFHRCFICQLLSGNRGRDPKCLVQCLLRITDDLIGKIRSRDFSASLSEAD